MQDQRIQDQKMRDQMSGVENAGPKNAGLENAERAEWSTVSKMCSQVEKHGSNKETVSSSSSSSSSSGFISPRANNTLHTQYKNNYN